MPHSKLFTLLLGLSVLLAIAMRYLVNRNMLISSGTGGVATGVVLLCLGMGFFAAYARPEASFSKPFLFFCHHLSSPASNKMALFYFVLTVTLGFSAIRSSFGLIGDAV